MVRGSPVTYLRSIAYCAYRIDFNRTTIVFKLISICLFVFSFDPPLLKTKYTKQIQKHDQIVYDGSDRCHLRPRVGRVNSCRQCRHVVLEKTVGEQKENIKTLIDPSITLLVVVIYCYNYYYLLHIVSTHLASYTDPLYTQHVYVIL